MDGFWTGGFWIGELWLVGHYWSDLAYSRAAEDWLQKLSPRIDSKSVFRGFSSIIEQFQVPSWLKARDLGDKHVRVRLRKCDWTHPS